VQPLTNLIRRYIGRVEAKYDRIEAGQTNDPGHQTAIGETGASVRKSMGYTKKEIKEMGWTEGSGPNANPNGPDAK
jgi:hypothetical protein